MSQWHFSCSEKALCVHQRIRKSLMSATARVHRRYSQPAIPRQQWNHEETHGHAHSIRATATVVIGAAFALSLLGPISPAFATGEEDNFENIPSQLGSAGEDGSQRLSSLFSGEKRKEIEGCTRKCVPTCVRGGSNGGAPGLGPISLRKEVIVFKDGFRSRSYCLTECANVCSLKIKGPS